MQTAGFRSMLTGETRAGSRALRQDSHLVSPDDLRFLPSDMYGYVLVPDGVDTKETAKDDVDLEEEAAASSSEEEEEWVAWPGPVRDDGLPYVAEGDDAASRLRLVVHPDVSLARARYYYSYYHWCDFLHSWSLSSLLSPRDASAL
jgi:hypothetical protein